MHVSVRKLTYSAMFIAVALLLPFLTGQIPEVGSMLSPMHIPILLCGFVCGWPYGLVTGLIAPLLRSAIFGMPPLYPVAAAMSLELAAYGAFAGLLYGWLPKKNAYLYVALILSMLIGRGVWGAARLAFAGLSGTSFTFSVFLAGAFATAWPGILLHLLVIPPIVLALRRAKLIPQ